MYAEQTHDCRAEGRTESTLPTQLNTTTATIASYFPPRRVIGGKLCDFQWLQGRGEVCRSNGTSDKQCQLESRLGEVTSLTAERVNSRLFRSMTTHANRLIKCRVSPSSSRSQTSNHLNRTALTG